MNRNFQVSQLSMQEILEKSIIFDKFKDRILKNSFFRKIRVKHPSMKTKQLLTTVILLLIVQLVLAQTTIVLQPGSLLGKDAYFRNLRPDSNQGSHTSFTSIAWTYSSVPVIARSIIDFDFSLIPSEAVIISAELSLYNNPKSQNNNGQHSTLNGSNTVVLKRVTSRWNETTVTWNNQPTTTSVNQVFIPQSTSPNQDYTNIDITRLVQDVIDNPSSSYGFMMSLETEEFYRAMIFSSSDHPDPSKHPKLVIRYRLNTDIQDIGGSENSLKIYPNPSSDYTIVKFNNPRNKIHLLKLYNNDGRLVLTKEVNKGSIQIERIDLANGTYLLRLESEGELVGLGKMVFE